MFESDPLKWLHCDNKRASIRASSPCSRPARDGERGTGNSLLYFSARFEGMENFTNKNIAEEIVQFIKLKIGE